MEGRQEAEAGGAPFEEIGCLWFEQRVGSVLQHLQPYVCHANCSNFQNCAKIRTEPVLIQQHLKVSTSSFGAETVLTVSEFANKRHQEER